MPLTIEHNTCQQCAGRIEYLQLVGWLHIDPAMCEVAEPAGPCCPSCGQLVYTVAISETITKITQHVANNLTCPGSNTFITWVV
jgi:hypothetical protein